MIRCWFFGGPAHLDEMEFEEARNFLALVISKDDKTAHLNQQLMETLGIPPPIGTYVAHYYKLSEWRGDVLYLFIGETGEFEDEED